MNEFTLHKSFDFNDLFGSGQMTNKKFWPIFKTLYDPRLLL